MISGGTPTGVQPYGTTQVNLTVMTNEPAIIRRIDSQPNKAYAAMASSSSSPAA